MDENIKGPTYDLTGQRFGTIVVLRLGDRRHRWYWWIRCDCGYETQMPSPALRCAETCKSCAAKNNPAKHGFAKHDGSMPAEYNIWQGINRRCMSKNDPSYHNYGGRGIKICSRWTSFANFMTDMGTRPSKYHQIERIDNDGNYEPGNCKWATKQEQARNRRTNVQLTFDGKTMCLKEWAEEIGIPDDVLGYRLKHGWSVEKILTTPLKYRRDNR